MEQVAYYPCGTQPALESILSPFFVVVLVLLHKKGLMRLGGILASPRGMWAISGAELPTNKGAQSSPGRREEPCRRFFMQRRARR